MPLVGFGREMQTMVYRTARTRTRGHSRACVASHPRARGMRDRVLFRARTLADVRQADYACAGARRTATGTPHRVAHIHTRECCTRSR